MSGMNGDCTRRKILLGTGTGLTGLLSGCSLFENEPRGEMPEVAGEDDGDDPETGQNTDEGTDNEYPRNPSESEYVENGQLKYPPLVTNFRIDELGEQSATVEMNVMPNPIDDYEISVHLTPLNEVPTEWEYRVPPSTWYGGTPTYDSDLGRWTGRDTNPVLAHRVPQEHGEQIDTITVPASAAGTASGEVPPLPDGIERSDIGNLSGEEKEAFEEWKNQIEGIGDRIDDQWREGLGVSESTEFEQIGGRLFDATPQALPFLVDVDLPSEIPQYEPFAITFQVHDENSPDSPTVAAFTGQFFRDDEGFDYPPVLQDDQNALKTQDFEDYYGNTVPVFDNIVNQYRGDGRAQGGGDQIVKEFTFYRTSSYGLYSEKIRDLASQSRERGDSSTNSAVLTPRAPVNFIDSPFQHPWSIEVEVTNGDAYEAEQTAERIKEDADHELFALSRSEEIRQHEIVQDLARQLKEVCDGIGATQPTEQIRVVADFVQYMSHITTGAPLDDKTIAASDIPPEFVPPGGHHPVWTLYNEVGDCEDYTVLANTILRTDYFGFDTAAASFEDVSILASSEVGHVSTAVPMSELEIDDVAEDQNVGSEDGEVNIYHPATFTYQDEEYVYVEASTVAPVGHVTQSVNFDVPPIHAEEDDYYN
jgi:hypothetical protein